MRCWQRWIPLWGRRGQEAKEAVIEVGKEGGLVDAVERAWFEFTYSV